MFSTTSVCSVLILAAFLCNNVRTFSTRSNTFSKRSSTTCLSATRRDFVVAAVAAATTTFSLPQTARADIDFDKVQDLLKSSQQPGVYEYSTPSRRPKYLMDPTEEFKENERKASDFKRAQLQEKQKFVKILEKLQEDPNDEAELAGDLDQLRQLVRTGGGLPLGITKEDVIKQVRRRKAKRYWPINVEIA